jgi:glycosyltransferase domain-containing protein
MLATAVIVSYNRQDILRRQLLYYANKPIHLIFADGSDDDWGGGCAGSIGKMTWEYFRISGYDSYIKRFVEAVRRVETEFMFLIDDEECILWTGVEKAVEFLKQNPDHSCAGGAVLRASKGLSAKRFQPKSFALSTWHNFNSLFDLTDSDPISRICKLNNEGRTANIYYQVHRSKIVKAYGQKIVNFDFIEKYIGTLEIIFTSFVIKHGKWVKGEYPYWFRFGDSVSSPNKLPRYMSAKNCEEVTRLLIEGDSLDLCDSTSSLQLVQVLQKTYGEVGILERVNRKIPIYKKMLKGKPLNLLARMRKVFKVYLFEVYPVFFELKYPDEAMRVKTYATRYAGGSKEVMADLAKFEDIWSRFSNGLSQSQYEQELARV